MYIYHTLYIVKHIQPTNKIQTHSHRFIGYLHKYIYLHIFCTTSSSCLMFFFIYMRDYQIEKIKTMIKNSILLNNAISIK